MTVLTGLSTASAQKQQRKDPALQGAAEHKPSLQKHGYRVRGAGSDSPITHPGKGWGWRCYQSPLAPGGGPTSCHDPAGKESVPFLPLASQQHHPGSNPVAEGKVAQGLRPTEKGLGGAVHRAGTQGVQPTEISPPGPL